MAALPSPPPSLESPGPRYCRLRVALRAWDAGAHPGWAGAGIGCGYSGAVALQLLVLAWLGHRVPAGTGPMLTGGLRLLTGTLVAMAGTAAAALVYLRLWTPRRTHPGFQGREGVFVLLVGASCWAAALVGAVAVRVGALLAGDADRLLSGALPAPVVLVLPPVIFAAWFAPLRRRLGPARRPLPRPARRP